MTSAIAPSFPFAIGQEVNWASEIPGLGIEITTEAVVVSVAQGDMFLDAFAWLLIWGDDHLTMAYTDHVPGDAFAVEAGKLSPTGRVFTTEDVERIMKHHGIED